VAAPGGRRGPELDVHPPRGLAAVDEAAAAVSVREVPVQVNGKLRDKVIVAADADQATIEREALAAPKIAALLDGRTPDRVIYAGGKLVNIVLRDA
jgi:leucyl-tRNA synthetase